MKNSHGFISVAVLLVIILGLVLVGGGAYYVMHQQSTPQAVACTQEAKLCPDGSSVGRTGPNCEFAACSQVQATNISTPNPSQQNLGTMYTSSKFGYSFSYPDDWHIISSDNLYAPQGSLDDVLIQSTDGKHLIHVLAYPLPTLLTSANCHAYSYDFKSNEWIRGQELGGKMCTGYDNSKDPVTVASNEKVGGLSAYADKTIDPTDFFIPVNSTYGIEIDVVNRSGDWSGDDIDATSRNIINTLNILSSPMSQIAVPGMSKYTDSDFGFSFWYPSNWTVNSPAGDEPGIGANLEDCTFKKSFSIHGKVLSNGVSIGEYYCPNLSMTLRGVGASPVGMDFKYYFDTNTHTWMVSDLSDPPNGSPRTTSAANVSNNTMGGLHILAGEARFGADVVIPLSARNFLIVSTNDVGGYIDERVFAKTIVATDPSVATPVSTAEQTKTVQAEKDAYGTLDDTPLQAIRVN